MIELTEIEENTENTGLNESELALKLESIHLF